MNNNYKTNIKELDLLLNNKGIVLPESSSIEGKNKNGIIILIKGRPGVGKSTLAMQLAYGLTETILKKSKKNKFNECYYYSLEQDIIDIQEKLYYITIEKIIYDTFDNYFIELFNDKYLNKIKIYAEKIKKNAINLLKFIYAKKEKLIFKINNKNLQNELNNLFCFCIDKYYDLLKYFFYKDKKKGATNTNTVSIDKLINEYFKIIEKKYEADEISKLKNTYLNFNDDIEKKLNIFINTIINKNENNKYQRRIFYNIFNAIHKLIYIKFYRSIESENLEAPVYSNTSQNLYYDINNFCKTYFDKEKEQCPLLVVDGLNILSKEEKDIINIHNLMDTLRKTVNISIIIYEPEVNENLYIEYISDLVIDMHSVMLDESVKFQSYELMISKARYQNIVIGWQQYKIKSSGIKIYPSIHYLLHKENKNNESPQRDLLNEAKINLKDWEKINKIKNKNILIPKVISSKNYEEIIKKLNDKDKNFIYDNYPPKFNNQLYILKPGIDRKNEKKISEILNSIKFIGNEPPVSIIEHLIGQKIKHGNSAVLLGPRASFKTELTLDFLQGGTIAEENGLIIDLMDNLPQKEEIVNLCIWRKKNKNRRVCSQKEKNKEKCLSRIYLFQQKPGLVSVAEFIDYLSDLINNLKSKGIKINRAVFWDLTQLEYRFPQLVKNPLFMTSFLNFFRNNDISVLFMGSGNSQLSKSAAAMADNVIYIWKDRQYFPDDHLEIYNNYIRNENKKDKVFEDNKKKINIKALKNIFEEEYLIFYIERSEGKSSHGKSIHNISTDKISKWQSCEEKIIKFDDINHEIDINYFKYSPDMYKEITEIQGMQ